MEIQFSITLEKIFIAKKKISKTELFSITLNLGSIEKHTITLRYPLMLQSKKTVCFQFGLGLVEIVPGIKV